MRRAPDRHATALSGQKRGWLHNRFMGCIIGTQYHAASIPLMKCLRLVHALLVGAALSGSAIHAQSIAPASPARASLGAFERMSDGIVVPSADGWLKLQPRSDSIVRVAFAKDRGFFERESLCIVPQPQLTAAWSVDANETSITLRTSNLQVRADRRTGALTFLTSQGEPIVAERADGRRLEPAFVQGEPTHHVLQQWEPNADESLHGLGQHQLGVVDIKEHDLELWQHNGTVVVPFLVSSRGYGILWDNASYSRFGDRREFTTIPAKSLSDIDGQSGGVTVTYFDDAAFSHERFRHRTADLGISLPESGPTPNTLLHPGLPPRGPISVRWEGTIEVEAEGAYLFQTFADNGAKLWIDDQLVIETWWQNWLAYAKQARVHLTPGKHRLRAEWSRDSGGTTMQVRWKTPVADRPTSLWSEVGDGIDYTFVYGPQLDHVVAGYRTLTGRATLLPIWTLGLWQSRQRYDTAQQSLDVLAEYRRRGIAIDNIVQDWFYWRKAEWGSHEFDPERFPNPQAWVDEIHNTYKARVMISVWGKFYPGTANYAALHQRGFLYQPLLWEGVKDWVGFPYTDYDAFNAEARKLFWEQVRDALFTKKFDAWWMDATEPDISSPPSLEKQKLRMTPTALGSGARVLNAYALLNSQGVYEGQRSTAPDQRVFILTRSGFAGLQRYASATWSGDIGSTWDSMHRQIAAGLGYSISGVPYWSMDIGGFTAPGRFLGKKLNPEAMDEWCELNARWFQFGALVPLVRLHGESQFREPWAFGGDQHPAFRAIVQMNRLRYRLLPYVYSQAGAVTHEHASFMRPLVMEFPADRTARAIDDQYLFGPAFLVAPVTQYKARERSVYLPETRGGWFNFWTGSHLATRGAHTVAAPYEQIPLFVRAGAIVPFGPDVQYTTEKPADPITLHVYAGADGEFTLYEDDGVTYGYERGAFARIPLRWNDAAKTLTIGARSGGFPGMLANRTFKIVLVSSAKPRGYPFEQEPDRTVMYRGEQVEVTGLR